MHGTTGYFDLQVNGYGGVDFNADGLTVESLERACELMRRDGVTAFLPTIITDSIPAMTRRVAAVRDCRERSALASEMIAGIHVEGPFLSTKPGYPGAHPIDAITPANVDVAKQLLDAGGGLVRLMTLAPECDGGLQTTRFLASQGVIVSAGHCDPTIDTLHAAIDAGLSMFTHLGNGCPGTLHRHDNVIQRVLAVARSRPIWCCFIADGVHIPPFALSNYLELASLERSIVVTDATAPSGLGPGTYTLGRWQVAVGPDMVARSPDGAHFLGSASTMANAAQLLRTQVRLNDAQIRQLAVENPRRALSGPLPRAGTAPRQEARSATPAGRTG